MKVADMMIPLQIDSDVLWTRVEDSAIAQSIWMVEGVLSEIEFATKFRKACTMAQKAIRMYHKAYTAVAEREQKRKRSKKDF